MSFMFHPYPYADPNAVNHVSGSNVHPTRGIQQTAKAIAGMLREGKKVALDAYPGADYLSLVNVVRQMTALPDGGDSCSFIDASTLLKTGEEIEAMLKPYLPTDRKADPVLLYGRRYLEGYDGLQDKNKVKEVAEKITGGTLVFGCGALAPSLEKLYDVRIWMDVTPRTSVLAFKNGKLRNIGAQTDLPFSLTMRRNYYVDFETAVEVRWNLIRSGFMDYYVSADIPEKMQMVSFQELKTLFLELEGQPFRCRPVYLEGVWGGYYVHRLRNLPKEMRNCAWVFDMIPMEVSIVAVTPEFEFEAPFFTFVQVMGEKLLGKEAYEQFGGYFPIRFNYDDTYHSSGNMSIQCHPDEEYVVTNHGEFGRQDESYYIVVTGQGAKTYLGFNKEDSCREFFEKAAIAEKTHELIDYDQYINAVPSIPGTQVMIPAGTVHASGRNQVILEIGSLTIGSYTYKLYDYQRIDPQTGLPRPIHLEMGSKVIRAERTHDWVEQNLVNHGGLVRSGDGWKEIIVGEHDLLYFSLRNEIFQKSISDSTDGYFHVLSLVDGEKVKVSSKKDPAKSYTMNSLDIVVVPADFGDYEIENLGVGTVTIHKTLLKH